MQFVSATDVLKFAIKLEEAAASSYEAAAEAVKDSGIKTIFRTLAAEEQKHKKFLAELELGKIPDVDSQEYNVNQCQELPKGMPFKLTYSKQQILEYAITAERESEYFYASQAKTNANNEVLHKLFLMLASLANQHVAKLNSLYNHPLFKS